MTQAELNRQVAHTTGETVNTIKHRGFVPLWDIPCDREPLLVDWDEVDAQRPVLFPVRQSPWRSVSTKPCPVLNINVATENWENFKKTERS